MSVQIRGPLLGQSAVCADILRALPEWFGIEDATQHYIDFIADHPTFVANQRGQTVGFLTLKQHFPQSAEIYVMGVRPDYHRQGIGRALVEAAEQHLRQENTLFLQVKTLGAAHPDPDYQKTRAFYLGVGFVPLEEFENLWERLPALQLVKRL